MTQDIFSISFFDSNQHIKTLKPYQGKEILIVNTASRCGLTPQYKGLKNLQTQFSTHLQIIGFPCNQFMNQEPENDEGIQKFCSLNFDLNFPVMSKIDVNGKQTHPLYIYLKSEEHGVGIDNIPWNFTKFLINPKGKIIKYYQPTDTPEMIANELNKLINY